MWVKEVLGIALVAATAAIALPRAVLPQRPPVVHTRRHTVEPAPTAPTPVVADEPDEAPTPSPQALPTTPLALDTPHERAPAHSNSDAPASRFPHGALVRRNGHWVADLRTLPPVRRFLAGTSLTPPGEGPQREGYLITRTDRNGILSSAGIRPGDVLIAVNGLPLRNPDDALEAVSRLRHETRATFVFQRGASRYSVPLELVGAPPGGLLAL